ncbi:MAG: 50S ribosome-binding GTPase [Candidatus ainarchaeum sp.]|nr:50S ribosome-binding GTPase [Candidatus ainarchaeum sp.]
MEKMGFIRQVYSLINQSDILLEVIDARFPDRTRNLAIENIIIQKEKALIFVLNKSDLVSRSKTAKSKKKLIEEKKARVVFISAKSRNGISLLKREISMVKSELKKSELTIGLIGYPNAGKSSLINALSGKGRGKVGVSSKAGFTRGLQKIKVSDGVYLIDAPGIIPYDQKDDFELFLVGARNPNQVDDVNTVAIKLISEFKEEIANYFKIKNYENLDEDEILEIIGKQNHFLKAGELIDEDKTSRFILNKYDRNEM